jgi:two-component system response regulator FixJ
MVVDKYHICVVDDNRAIRVAFSTLLEMADYNVSKFDSGKAFLKYHENEVTDCIILDLDMPGMSGTEVLDELEKFNSGPPIIVVTGTPNQAMLDDANRDIVARILSKPVDPTELLDEVSKIVGTA